MTSLPPQLSLIVGRKPIAQRGDIITISLFLIFFPILLHLLILTVLLTIISEPSWVSGWGDREEGEVGH